MLYCLKLSEKTEDVRNSNEYNMTLMKIMAQV